MIVINGKGRGPMKIVGSYVFIVLSIILFAVNMTQRRAMLDRMVEERKARAASSQPYKTSPIRRVSWYPIIAWLGTVGLLGWSLRPSYGEALRIGRDGLESPVAPGSRKHLTIRWNQIVSMRLMQPEELRAESAFAKAPDKLFGPAHALLRFDLNCDPAETVPPGAFMHWLARCELALMSKHFHVEPGARAHFELLRGTGIPREAILQVVHMMWTDPAARQRYGGPDQRYRIRVEGDGRVGLAQEA